MQCDSLGRLAVCPFDACDQRTQRGSCAQGGLAELQFTQGAILFSSPKSSRMTTKGVDTRLKTYKYNDRDQAVSEVK